MEIYQLITLIIVLTAAFGYINFRFIKLPATIGIMLMAMVASLSIILIGQTHAGFFTQVTNLVSGIDFNTVLMKVMLEFLLLLCSTIYCKHYGARYR
ncbi:MAG: hypothetical protein EOO61_11310 [Hymenobacter sp.]|nr:MAG: hypothetical protein EOO61_11310 [Hymenobacter sp.]